LYTQNYDAATEAAIASAKNSASLISAGIGAVGTMAGGMMCWVARAVYGDQDPRWLLFRSWLLTKAPVWFRELYRIYGPTVAAIIKRIPLLRWPIKWWMDRRIRNAQQEGFNVEGG
jgi:hypothetical protein